MITKRQPFIKKNVGINFSHIENFSEGLFCYFGGELNPLILLKKENWIRNYIFWELELFKVIGYDLELKNLVKKELINNEVKYLVKSTKEKKIVPNFLIDNNQDFLNEEILIDGLRLVGDYLEKSILRPNNINYPLSRLRFLNTFK